MSAQHAPIDPTLLTTILGLFQPETLVCLAALFVVSQAIRKIK